MFTTVVLIHLIFEITMNRPKQLLSWWKIFHDDKIRLVLVIMVRPIR